MQAKNNRKLTVNALTTIHNHDIDVTEKKKKKEKKAKTKRNKYSSIYNISMIF
jgi:hypothetical protein